MVDELVERASCRTVRASSEDPFRQFSTYLQKSFFLFQRSLTMVFEEVTETDANAIEQPKIQCLDCHCIGVLLQKNDKVYLSPEEVLSSRSIHTQKRDLKEW